jgi:hypothetical protein
MSRCRGVEPLEALAHLESAAFTGVWASAHLGAQAGETGASAPQGGSRPLAASEVRRRRIEVCFASAVGDSYADNQLLGQGACRIWRRRPRERNHQTSTCRRCGCDFGEGDRLWRLPCG